MRKTIQVEIETDLGPGTIHITQIGGLIAAKMLVQQAPTLIQAADMIKGLDLKAIKAAGSAEAKVEAVKKLDISKFAPMLAALKPDEFELIALTLLRGAYAVVEVDSQGGRKKIDILGAKDLDQLFTGQVWGLFKVIGSAVALNFGF